MTCEIIKTVTSVIPGVLPAVPPVPIDLDAIRRIVREEIMHQEGEMHRLRTQRDALLEALNLIASDACADMPAMMQNIARAAIAKAEGEQA